MSENTNSLPINLEKRSAKRASLIKRLLGARAIKHAPRPQETDDNLPGRTLLKFAIENARREGKDLIARALDPFSYVTAEEEKQNGTYLAQLIPAVRAIDESFSPFLGKARKKSQEGWTGLSKENPWEVFRGKLTAESQQLASDVSVVLGASEIPEPQVIPLGEEGATREIREYESASGLSFIDTRSFLVTSQVGDSVPLTEHRLFIYLDTATKQ